MPNPDYISGQTEIEWSMRSTLVDWLMQVHMRYHMLPETLWIAINIVDRFLSKRVGVVLVWLFVPILTVFAGRVSHQASTRRRYRHVHRCQVRGDSCPFG